VPVNTSGGSESKGHPIAATGLGQIHESVTQLRGEAGARQVEGARIAAHENGGGSLGIEEAVVAVIQSNEQAMAVDGSRRFLAAEVDPSFSKDYRDRFMPRDVMAGLMRRLSDFGSVSGVVSPAAGGSGSDWSTSSMSFEEVAACSVDLSVPVSINAFGAYSSEQVASPESRERYSPGSIAGDSFVSMGISEPGVGSNVMEVRTRARRDGDHWIISGEKTWISNGAYSDFSICSCRTSDDPRE
ncbi:hypothetical protein OY671_008697, partial [Metschnikowia pulcherrima]